MDKLMDKVLKGIYDYYQNILLEKHKRVKFTGNIYNPYDISDWLLNISEACKYADDVELECHLQPIFEFLGYYDIVLGFRRGELDVPLDYSDDIFEDRNWQTYFSYKKAEYAADSPLSFVKTYGVNHEPMEFIPFICNTIAAYEMEKLFDIRYHG